MRTHFRHIALALSLSVLAHSAKAQDPHFSQYFASPLTLNPALTGNTDGALRAASLFRQQWWTVGSGYTTSTLSYEQRLMRFRMPEADRLGVGGLVIQDNSLSGGLRSTYASLSAAYLKGFNDFHRLGVGFQGTYGNRVVDMGRLSFHEQFDTDGFNTNLPSGEAALSALMPTMGVNAGVVYQYEDLLRRLYLGASMYHLNRPRQTALSDSTNRVPQRFTLHGGGVFLSGEALRLTVHALYQRQARAQEFAFGGAVGYDVGVEHTFFVGAWHRLGDAVYPYLSYVRNGMQVGLTYDLPVSSMRQAVPRNGSIEISLMYTRPDDRYERRAMPWYY